MKEEYKPKTLHDKLHYMSEECGELISALGKSGRWGLFSANYELPEDQQEANLDWILREMEDVERAISFLRPALQEAYSSWRDGN